MAQEPYEPKHRSYAPPVDKALVECLHDGVHKSDNVEEYQSFYDSNERKFIFISGGYITEVYADEIEPVTGTDKDPISYSPQYYTNMYNDSFKTTLIDIAL